MINKVMNLDSFEEQKKKKKKKKGMEKIFVTENGIIYNSFCIYSRMKT